MPYGIPTKQGGESLDNVAKMERCVNDIMAQGKSKSSAIAMCKASLGFTKSGKRTTRV